MTQTLVRPTAIDVLILRATSASEACEVRKNGNARSAAAMVMPTTF